MATEIVAAQLYPGKSLDDTNSAAGQVFQDTLETMAQQEGYQRSYWGVEVENPTIFRLFADWDSVEDHINFTQSEPYQPFLKRFAQVADLSSLSFVHVHFQPHSPSAALSSQTSPVTEVNTIYLPTDLTELQQQEYHEAFTRQVQSIKEKCEKTSGAASGGWGVEELTVPGTSEKAKVYIGVIGWQSMEDAVAYRQSDERKQTQQLFKDFESLIKFTDIKYTSLTQKQPRRH